MIITDVMTFFLIGYYLCLVKRGGKLDELIKIPNYSTYRNFGEIYRHGGSLIAMVHGCATLANGLNVWSYEHL